MAKESELSFFVDHRFDDKHIKTKGLLVISVAALVVTATGLGIALYLGTIGYEIRRTHMHNTRLSRILVQTPTVYQVTVGLQEKAPLLLTVGTDAELERAILYWGKPKSSEIEKKALKWSQLRLYDAGDMVYFIYFDESDVMQDYVYVTNRKGDL